MNGLQVDNDGCDFSCVAFAVDACEETFHRAIQSGAGCLVVHHGLFWGSPLALKGPHRQRLKTLLEGNLALYAIHLPLDHHPELGNNAALADLLGLQDREPFGLYKGKKLGYKGHFASPIGVDEAVSRIDPQGRTKPNILAFGPALNKTCAVISGGAAHEAGQALEEGLDLYVTGELSHEIYHQALEGGLNLIGGGHYETEIWGVKRVMARMAEETGVDALFIDAPTGL